MNLSDKVISLLKEEDYSFEELKKETNSNFFELRDSLRELLKKENKVLYNGKVPKEDNCEIFNFNEKLETMKTSNDKRIKIIALYWEAKKYTIDNNEQYKSSIKRNLRASYDLKGYSLTKIKDTMEFLEQTANYKWTLETITKFIDEDISNLTQKTMTTEERERYIINKFKK
jgi:hypothetical protein